MATRQHLETDPSIVGTWRIVSFSSISQSTGKQDFPYGHSPKGYLQYSADGHVVVFLSSSEKAPLAMGGLSDRDRIVMHQAIIAAYAGTYFVDAARNRIVHRILTASRADWIGEDQIRFFELSDTMLSIRTAPLTMSSTGESAVAELRFMREA